MGGGCVPELIAKGALDGVAARVSGGVTLEPLQEHEIWSIAVFPGGGTAVASVLAPLGLTFPGPGEWLVVGESSIVWSGRDQAFLFGPCPPRLEGAAAVTDQSGGWAGIAVSGSGAVAVLARLVSVDLRLAAFAPGRVVRSALNHIPALILRRSETAFEIRVFRSMARTAWHELTEAQDHLAARG